MNRSYLIFAPNCGWRSSMRGGLYTPDADMAWRFSRHEAVDYCYRMRNKLRCVPVREEDVIAAGLKKEAL